MSNIQKGMLSAVVAQFLWGLFPLYWKLVADVHSLEVLSHRNTWCAVFLGALVIFTSNRRKIVRGVLLNTSELKQHLMSSCLIAANWLVYIWAVNNNHVIDASLGYFLSPLVSVVLGRVVFAERLSTAQWCAIALAASGVLALTIASGVIPWIGLTIAATFGLYGMTRKKASTGPINGLFIETLLLVPPSILAMWWLSSQGELSYSQPLGRSELLLVLGGLVTAIPLVLYAQGARALPLSLSGLLVFITPTIQFLIGWLLYREPISAASWFGFACIWLALIIYCIVLMQRLSHEAKDDEQVAT